LFSLELGINTDSSEKEALANNIKRHLWQKVYYICIKVYSIAFGCNLSVFQAIPAIGLDGLVYRYISFGICCRHRVVFLLLIPIYFPFICVENKYIATKMSLYNFKKIMVVPPAKVSRKTLLFGLCPLEHLMHAT